MTPDMTRERDIGSVGRSPQGKVNGRHDHCLQYNPCIVEGRKVDISYVTEMCAKFRVGGG